MSNMRKFFSMILRIYYTFKAVGLPDFNNPQADYIIWAPNFFSIRFLYGDNLQKVMFTYFHLKSNCKTPTIWLKKNIGIFDNKKIIYFASHEYNIYGFSNYMDSLIHITKNLEAQGNSVFPILMKSLFGRIRRRCIIYLIY